ncbi:MAG: hypothetical protein ACRYGF_15055 [Janthinobacterium lividum]
MDEFRGVEEDLHRSLRRVPAPDGFTGRVMLRVAEREIGRRTPDIHEVRHRGLSIAGHSRAAWWTALAAMLALTVGGGDLLHLRHQRQVQQATAAQAQVDLAMQLTSHALNEVEIGLDRSPAGRFTHFLNGTQ